MARGPKAQFDADFGKFVAELNRADVKLREFSASSDASSTNSGAHSAG